MSEILPGITIVQQIGEGFKTMTASLFRDNEEGSERQLTAVAVMIISDHGPIHLGIHRRVLVSGADYEHCLMVNGPCSFIKDVLTGKHLPFTTEEQQQLLIARLGR